MPSFHTFWVPGSAFCPSRIFSGFSQPRHRKWLDTRIRIALEFTVTKMYKVPQILLEERSSNNVDQIPGGYTLGGKVGCPKEGCCRSAGRISGPCGERV